MTDLTTITGPAIVCGAAAAVAVAATVPHKTDKKVKRGRKGKGKRKRYCVEMFLEHSTQERKIRKHLCCFVDSVFETT